MNESVPYDLVSVIIPCYNHGKYLSTAVQSILGQTYKHHEIIVVDDGSVDDTKKIAAGFSSVKYIYQPNKGLSAARNKGIDNSSGNYLVFLDADDWLLPAALETNLQYLKRDPAIAFAHGAHRFFLEGTGETWDVQNDIREGHYLALLERNYIGMHATVMYRRSIFNEYRFDEQLKACEDYDLYLNITRTHKIHCHPSCIAVYQLHDSNMSGNYMMMLDHALLVLNRQQKYLNNEKEKGWYEKGLEFWKAYYAEKILNNLLTQLYGLKEGMKINKKELKYLKRINPLQHMQFMAESKTYRAENNSMILSQKTKSLLKKILPEKVVALLRKNKSTTRVTDKINFGDLDRVTPFSTQFGYDRGGPVDRYYIESFLERMSSSIQGRALEIGDNEYTLRFGQSNITQSDILHIDESNPKATFIGDLSNADHIPSNAFDCIILTQTLHLIYDYREAVQTCYRILKPGGCLLLTVPGISQIANDEWRKYWLWSFTDTSIKKILSEFFAVDRLTVETFGNVFAATAFLYGVGLPEIKKEQLDHTDPLYQVIITAAAVK